MLTERCKAWDLMTNCSLLLRTIIYDDNNYIQAITIGLPVGPIVSRSPSPMKIWFSYPITDHGRQRKRRPNDTKLMICMDAQHISAFAEPVTKLAKYYLLFGQFRFLLSWQAKFGSARVDK